MSNINTLTEIIEKQWNRNINKKVNTAKKLIEFKDTITLSNKKGFTFFSEALNVS